MPAEKAMLGLMDLILLLGNVTLVGAKSLHFVYRGGQIVGVYILYKGGKKVHKSLKKRRHKRTRNYG